MSQEARSVQGAQRTRVPRLTAPQREPHETSTHGGSRGPREPDLRRRSLSPQEKQQGPHRLHFLSPATVTVGHWQNIKGN